MNKSIYLLLLLCLVSCESKMISLGSYEMGIENCNNNPKFTSMFNAVTQDSIKFKSYDEKHLIGYNLPQFEVQTIAGKTITNQSILGKPSIITFWFETCPPCIAEIPGFNILAERYDSSKVNYLAIGNDTEISIKEFIKKQPFNFDLVANGEKIYRDSFSSYWGYPFTFVTNKEGIILNAFSGGKTDSTAIQMIIDKIEPDLKKELNL